MTAPWIRRSALSLGVLALLLAAVAGVLLASFDGPRLRALAVEQMQSRYQRTLRVDGPVQLSVFPRLAVQLGALRLSEAGRDDEFLALDEAQLSLRVLPLLRGRLVVDRVAARGLRAVWRRQADGRANVDDLVGVSGSSGPSGPFGVSGVSGAPGGPGGPGGSGGPVEGAGPSAGGAPLAFDIRGVQLEDLRLRVQDEMTGVVGEFALPSLTTGRLAPGVEADVALRAAVTLERPRALQATLQARARLALDAGAAGLSMSDLQVALDGAQAGAFTLGPSTLALQRLVVGTGSGAASSSGAAVPRRVELQGLKLALAGRQGDSPWSLSLQAPRLALAGDALSGEPVEGRVQRDGATAVTGTLRGAAPGGTLQALRWPGLVLALQTRAGTQRIDATLRGDLQLDAAERSARLEPLALQASVADGGAPPLQLQAQGSAAAAADTLRWTLSGLLDGQTLATQGQADFSAAVPAVRASARFGALDLNRWLPPVPAAPASAPPAPGAEPTLPLAALKAVDAELQLEAASLALRQFRFTALSAQASLRGGELQLPRLAAQAWGGRFSGSGQADAQGRRLALKLEAEGVDVNALLRDVAGRDVLEGRGQVSADLSSSGNTLGALRRQLAGRATLRLRDGAVKGFNLARALREAKAALSGRRDAVVRSRATEKTDFSELSLSAGIDAGVATSRDLELKSPFLRVGGEGLVDIGRGRIDYTARATVANTATGQDGEGLQALRGLTVPVRLTGPYEALDWKIVWSEVAAGALKNQLRDKLGEALGQRLGLPADPAASAPQRLQDRLNERLNDGLKDRLKGLLK